MANSSIHIRKLAVLIFLILWSIEASKINFDYVPPPTINYKHSVGKEIKICIEMCSECFSISEPETKKNAIFNF